jgi:hypothetical protein
MICLGVTLWKTDLEDMSPVLPLIIESFVQHLHDLDKVVSAVSDEYLWLAGE